MNELDLEQAWSSLEAQSPANLEFRVWPVGVEVEGGSVYVAVDHSGGRHLLVPHQAASVCEDTRSAGVTIRERKLDVDARLRSFADVCCAFLHLNALFSTLTAEMLSAMQKAPDDPSRACCRTLARWRELLNRPAGHALSEETLAGLYGELHVLSQLADSNPDAVHYWTGPDAARQDFTFPAGAIEVKSTRARTGWSFEVHGHTQLEADGRLLLTAIRLEVTPSGNTVQSLIETLLDAGTDRYELLRRLAAVGYDYASGAENTTCFRLVEQRTYNVDDSFPRIVNASFINGVLPPGVLNLSYRIDLSGAVPVPLSDEQQHSAFKDLAGGNTSHGSA